MVRTAERLEDLLRSLEVLRGHLRPGGPDRISLRAVVDDDLLLEHATTIETWVEAALPLSGVLTGCSLVYLGANHASRACNPADVERCRRNVERAAAESVRSASAVAERALTHGYRLEVLDAEQRLGDPRLVAGIARLYRRFGWSDSDTRRLLGSPDTLLGVAWRGDEVTCAGLAEQVLLRFGDGEELRLAEFTEAATHDAHRRRGLYSAVCGALMAELVDRSRRNAVLGGGIDLAFGECSGLDGGVLVAATRLGRRFACRARIDLPFAGVLRQHVPIDGTPRATPYNDLYPTFITADALERWVET
ncbi:MAG: hypothetical protein AAGC60_16080 [Acidobacteriota bacterium]